MTAHDPHVVNDARVSTAEHDIAAVIRDCSDVIPGPHVLTTRKQ